MYIIHFNRKVFDRLFDWNFNTNLAEELLSTFDVMKSRNSSQKCLKSLENFYCSNILEFVLLESKTELILTSN